MVKMEKSKLICTECGAEMLIPRQRGQRREQGHIKHLHCYKCKKTTAFVEGVAKDTQEEFWDQWQTQGVDNDE